MALKPKSPEEVSPNEVAAAAGDFLSLIQEKLPARFEADVEEWEAFSLPFLCRITTSFDSCVRLATLGRHGDSYVLFRSLYEHIVNYFWLAIDPGTNVDLWIKHSQRRQLVLDRDMRSVGFDVLSDEDREAFSMNPLLGDLKQRAEAADGHWAQRLPGFRDLADEGEYMLTLTGMYQGIYRTGSRLVHGEPWSLDEYIELTDPNVYLVRFREEKSWYLRINLEVWMVANAFEVHRFDHG